MMEAAIAAGGVSESDPYRSAIITNTMVQYLTPAVTDAAVITNVMVQYLTPLPTPLSGEE